MGVLDYKLSYRRNLPHLQPAGATLFITFRLAGSLPKFLVEQWNQERKWLAHMEQTNPDHFARVKSDFERTWFAKFESVLDGALLPDIRMEGPDEHKHPAMLRGPSSVSHGMPDYRTNPYEWPACS